MDPIDISHHQNEIKQRRERQGRGEEEVSIKNSAYSAASAVNFEFSRSLTTAALFRDFRVFRGDIRNPRAALRLMALFLLCDSI